MLVSASATGSGCSTQVPGCVHQIMFTRSTRKNRSSLTQPHHHRIDVSIKGAMKQLLIHQDQAPPLKLPMCTHRHALDSCSTLANYRTHKCVGHEEENRALVALNIRLKEIELVIPVLSHAYYLSEGTTSNHT